MSVSSLHFEPSYKSLVDEFSKPIAVFDETLRLIYFNHQYEAVFGRSVASLFDLVSKDDDLSVTELPGCIRQKRSWRGQVIGGLTDTGRYSVKVIQLPNTLKPRYVGVFDAESLKLVKAPSQRVLLDDLTELPNRYAFLDELTQHIALNKSGNDDFAVLYIDLDHFKDINELHGHEIGDELLKLCAEKIRQMLRRDDLLARLSGDEFAAIVSCEQAHEMQYLCHRLLRYFERPVQMGGKHYQFTVSIGVAFYPDQGASPQDLIINAEKAMFEAKKQGRAQFQLYDRHQSQKIEQQQRLAESLRRVLQQAPEQFQAAYQPLYNIQSGDFIGMEVLARWASPEFGQVSPAEFIPLAESRGLINTLSSLIFNCIRRDIRSVNLADRVEKPLLAVNISAQQIIDPFFEHLLMTFWRDVTDAGWQLEVELTESQLMTYTDGIIEKLETWRHKGIRIAIDDFGTGYSCLAYLHMLPVDKLKIDRQFLRTQTQARKEDQIMYAIMSMAKALDIEVLAEGVETKEQFRRLQQLGCNSGQGFGLARPQPWDTKLMTALDL